MANLWYACMMDLEDNDWGIGSYDLDEAMDKVRGWRSNGRPDAYIAVISEDHDAVCVEEIHDIV